MDVKYTVCKLIRLYQLDDVFLVLRLTRFLIKSNSNVTKERILYSFVTISNILALLHYLACLWLYIGLPQMAETYYARYGAADEVPWILGTDEFAVMGKYELYVFAIYWVCTVITTVGYGDYSGATSFEFCVTMFLEFFGIFIFAYLSIAMNKLFDTSDSHSTYITAVESDLDMWLLKLENSH